MKSIKFIYKISGQIKSKAEDFLTLKKGLMRVLLKRYKPKVLYNIETFCKIKFQRRVA